MVASIEVDFCTKRATRQLGSQAGSHVCQSFHYIFFARASAAPCRAVRAQFTAPGSTTLLAAQAEIELPVWPCPSQAISGRLASHGQRGAPIRRNVSPSCGRKEREKVIVPDQPPALFQGCQRRIAVVWVKSPARCVSRSERYRAERQ